MSKHVLVLGGLGEISELLTPLLLGRAWAVTSVISTEEQPQAVRKLGEGLEGELKVLVQNLEDVRSEKKAREILEEVKPDYVFWGAGAGDEAGAERTFAIDRDAAIHFIKASTKISGITRFLSVSYLGARRNKPSWWSDDDWKAAEEVNKRLPDYYKAKLAADEALYEESARRGKDFVGISLRPGKLTSDPVGGVDLGKTNSSRGSVGRETVAWVATLLLDAEADDVNSSWLDLLGGGEIITQAVYRVFKAEEDAAEGEPVYKKPQTDE